MQKFASTCLRQIILGKYDAEKEDFGICNNALIYKHNVPTIHSQLMRAKLCDIYRWGTSVSQEYLNNKAECDDILNMWKTRRSE